MRIVSAPGPRSRFSSRDHLLRENEMCLWVVSPECRRSLSPSEAIGKAIDHYCTRTVRRSVHAVGPGPMLALVGLLAAPSLLAPPGSGLYGAAVCATAAPRGHVQLFRTAAVKPPSSQGPLPARRPDVPSSRRAPDGLASDVIRRKLCGGTRSANGRTGDTDGRADGSAALLADAR